MSEHFADDEFITYDELRELQKQETREIVEALLEDGSEPDALYPIEHHLSALDFSVLEDAAVEAFKLGFEVFEAEEVELEDGSKVLCFDATMESPLSIELIDKQVEQLIDLAEKLDIEYDGWGTYFDDGEEADEEADASEDEQPE
ncbi:ribonuclease E inhibitor RraB [Vibrio sp. SS-MA-C1-2]|uniref:ribonuclease E inhibitor RraB n=1 Tax=Vibrio sp. SS-MA-C1-2 TaxID=2908646 RepID=UPI001F350BE3|nr:ribonuclease E inhibitor RraB [Vibrio sp. SS-MA-C1-2]UJF19094.1 ribonuclease E inhibitor RraB [Vibrio sp. SS-MA-C1-2]